MSRPPKSIKRATPDKPFTRAVTISRILWVSDLSPPSFSALNYAASFARAHQARLYIFHALDNLLPRNEGFINRYLVDVAYEQLTVDRDIKLLPIAGSGNPAEAALQAAQEHNIDLLVMHSRRRPLGAALFGSTAETICHNASCAVFVVHTDEQEWAASAGRGLRPQNILVALDYSPYSLLALAYGETLRKGYDARLHLLNVIPVELATAWAVPPEDVKKAAVHKLINTVPEALYMGGKIEIDVREGEPSGAILDYAREQKIDLICIGAHGEGKRGLSGITILGSNTDYVLRQSPCPVLIARR